MSKRRVAEELCISYTTLVSIVSCRKAMMNSPMGNLARSRISLSKSKKKDFHRDKGKEIDIENEDTVVVRKAPRMPYTQGTRKTRKVVSMAEMLTAYDTLMEEQEMSTQRAAEELGISHRSLLSVVSCREEIKNCPEGTLACSKFYLYAKKTISSLEEEHDKIPQLVMEDKVEKVQKEATMPRTKTTPQTKPKQKRMSMAEILKAFDTLVVEEEEMSTLRAAEKLNIPYPTLLSVLTCRKEIENCPEGGLAQTKFNLTDAKLSPVVQEERVKRKYSKLPQLSMKDECYECPKCPAKKSNKNNLVFHMRRVHLWGQFSCAQCGTKAEYADDLLAHIKENDHTQDPLVKCPFCEDRVPVDEIKPHYYDCINKRVKKLRREKIMCTTCGKIVSKGNMSDHRRMHMREQGVSEGDTKSKLYFYCEMCGKKVSSAKSLANHKRHVHNPVPTTCPACGVIFPNRHKMIAHRDREHNPKRFSCNSCEYATHSAFFLKAHMRKHSDPEFRCGYCEKMLKSRETLEVHEREHTGERPFECEACGKGFKSKTVLATHRKHVHKILTPGMKPIEKRVRRK